MTSHRAHPDNEPEAILYDGCDRCTEHANQPTGLDITRLAQAWTLMMTVETGRPHRQLTDTEGRLVRRLAEVRTIVDRLGFVAPLDQYRRVAR